MLDGEDDPKLQRDVRECISTLLGALAAAKPSHWLVLCNQVLSGESEKESQATATAEETQAASVAAAKSRGSQSEAAGGEDEEEEEGGDSSRVKVAVAVRTVLPTRWQTKVFAVACVRHIIQVCCEQRATDNPHTNVAAARRHPHGDFLVLRLSEIIRTCFIAATSTVDQLRQVWKKGRAARDARDSLPLFSSSRSAWRHWRLSLLLLPPRVIWILMATTASSNSSRRR